MESTLLAVSIGLVSVVLGFEALRRALLDVARNRLYRIRDRIHRRVIEGELEYDEVVKELVESIHAFIYIIEHWPIPQLMDAIKRAQRMSVEEREQLRLARSVDERIRSEFYDFLSAGAFGMLIVSMRFRYIAAGGMIAIVWSGFGALITSKVVGVLNAMISTPIVTPGERITVAHG